MYIIGLPGGTVVKNLPANEGDSRDVGLIPRWGRSPGGGNGNPLQYSCQDNPMDRGAWQGYSPWGHKESDKTEHACIYSFTSRKAVIRVDLWLSVSLSGIKI